MYICRYWLVLMLLVSFSSQAEECKQIWPSAVTEATNTPASVTYSPANPTMINNFSGNFGPGDYQIGTHTVPNGTVLTTTGATTRIFVNGNLVLNNNVSLNAGGPPENLLIVVTGSLSVFNNSVIRGFVLVGGSVFFSNNASINGGLTARGSISGWNNSNATYNASALTRLKGGVVCGAQTVPEQIDHFEFSYSGQALTCKAETFTIKACKNAACSELITTAVSATLSPASGWISGTGLTGGNVLNFSGGTATATLSQTTPATVVVGVSSSVPATKPLSTTLCQIGASLSAANCSVLFASSGLVFSVADKLAGKEVDNIRVRAVKSDGSQQCVPSFSNVNRSVSFWSEYVSPLVPLSNPAARISLRHGASSGTIGTSSGSATPMTLSFNANGEASIALNYADAGQLNLHARYNGSAATNDAGLVLLGSDAFVSAPHGLCIETAQVCLSADATCPAFKKTGENFTATFSARAWQADIDTNFCDNARTPSFSLTAIPLSHTLEQPAAGALGVLSPNQYNHLAQVNAETALTTLNLSEVGLFKLRAGGNLTYLGFPIELGSSMVNPLGRIVPDHFKLTYSKISHTSTCDTFFYLSQPALLDVSVEAVNHHGDVTQNYRGDFAKATTALVAENNNNGTDLTNRILPLPVDMAWQHGVSARTALPFSLLREATVDGPFESVLFGLTLDDKDNFSELADLDQHPATTNNTATDDCVDSNNCLSKTLDDAKPWRYGRLQIINALGSEQSNLPVQLKAEYWHGQQFVPHTADKCSPVQPALLQATAMTPGAPVLTVSGNNSTLQNGSSAAFDLLLSPPGIESSYKLQYQLDAFPWLQYDWVPDNGQLSENPSGEAVFGGFRGNNRQIFWREN